MASKAASKRLTKEYVAMQKEPPPFVWAAPDEKNILNWNYIIRGPPDSPFAGGEYHGMIMFPPEYPFKPPGIKMITPSGRFQPDRKICFSMSDFHPGTWNPAWSVATILTGLLSFMLSDEVTTGAIKATDAQKRHYAQKSHSWNIAQARFREAFPEYSEPVMKDLPNMGGTPSPSSTASARSTPAPADSQQQQSQPLSQQQQLLQQQSTPLQRPNDPFYRPTPMTMSSSTNSSSSGSMTSFNSAAAGNTNPNTAAGNVNANVNAAAAGVVAVNWVNSALRVLWDKWRWGAVIVLAVIVSRVSSK